MALKQEWGFSSASLAMVLSFFCLAAVQNTTAPPEERSRTQSASSKIDRPTETTHEDDFCRRVAGRWQSARKGQIAVYVSPDKADPETYRIRVVATRAPAGSDGMTQLTLPAAATWGALLKLDDELRVRITPQTSGTLTIEPLARGTDSLIQHLDPGGHAEWTWTLKKRARQDEDRFQLQADVVYSRKASSGREPAVTYPSLESVISVPEAPAHFPANPHASPSRQ